VGRKISDEIRWDRRHMNRFVTKTSRAKWPKRLQSNPQNSLSRVETKREDEPYSHSEFVLSGGTCCGGIVRGGVKGWLVLLRKRQSSSGNRARTLQRWEKHSDVTGPEPKGLTCKDGYLIAGRNFSMETNPEKGGGSQASKNLYGTQFRREGQKGRGKEER